MGMFLHRIARYPLLTREQEQELAHRMRVGDRRAREQFINSNLRLVVCLAKKYSSSLPGTGMTLMDLIQEGTIGLQTGIDKFDPDRGFKASTMLYWWIYQAITRALRNQGRTIRLPTHIFERFQRWLRAKEQFVQAHGRSPNAEESAALLVEIGLKRRALDAILATKARSLDVLTGEDQNTSLLEMLADPTSGPGTDLEQDDRRQELVEVLRSARLTEQEYQVLWLAYGDGERSDAIAQQLGLTLEQVRVLRKTAMRKCRYRAGHQRQGRAGAAA
ncbi:MULTISPECIES: sigma-70 family RNA polymerase sigma factor [Cyanophyceae]|uniref:Sigma-70 family RNA polymerase sigma factor n=1 Tax=Leptolyngbya subtilissima DQ-A4 TaxID=2933933 RepID=A0ABV0KC35_9CYAN|nr:sigma-70 family RNA polymerase sigma factor [Nodosilinea sp. FACHB-141]MBD2115257.1 sigma-70 family RNA polymerase sigma factor [Nodosilinea sp. FACHB-141]